MKQSELRVVSELTDSTLVLEWFETNWQPILPDSFYWQCQVILIEGFTNTVRHAHRNLPNNTPIEIEIIQSSELLEIRILDQGDAFDLEDYLANIDPEDCQSLEREEGRGLYFIKQLTDYLDYTPVSPKGNCLIMGKYFPRLAN